MLPSQPLRFSSPSADGPSRVCLPSLLPLGRIRIWGIPRKSPREPDSARRCPSTPGPRRLARTRPQWRSPSPFCPGQPASASRDRQSPLPGIRGPTDLSEDCSERGFWRWGGKTGNISRVSPGESKRVRRFARPLERWGGGKPRYFSPLPPSGSGTYQLRFHGPRPLFRRTFLASQGHEKDFAAFPVSQRRSGPFQLCGVRWLFLAFPQAYPSHSAQLGEQKRAKDLWLRMLQGPLASSRFPFLHFPRGRRKGKG